MILTKLKDHLVANGKTSRTQIAQYFGMSEDGVDAMLNVWIAKNKVSKIDAGTEVWYRWNHDDELSVTTKL